MPNHRSIVKNVYHIKNLRTKEFHEIYGLLWLVFITHNLINWFKSSTLYSTVLENVGVKVLIKRIGNIKVFVERTSEGIKVNIPLITKLSKLIVDALCSPRYLKQAQSLTSSQAPQGYAVCVEIWSLDSTSKTTTLLFALKEK